MPKLPPPRPSLRPYQVQGVEWMHSHPRTLLGSEMGLGKSVQALLASEGRTLIIAPAMAIHGGVWRSEVEKWCPERAGDIVTVPYTSLLAREGRKVAERVRPEYAGHWDSVIMDEAHTIKSRKAKWTKPIENLCRNADRVRMLSGTPVKNFAPELYQLLRVLRPEDAKGGGLLGSYWRWVGEWFDIQTVDVRTRYGVIPTQEVHGLKAGDNPDAWEAFFNANCGDLLRRHTREECLPDLPPLTRQLIECPMTPAQAKAYRGFKKDYVAEMPDGALKVAWNSGAKNTINDRCATGLGIADDGISVPLDGESGKLDVLRDLLDNRDRPTLVFAWFRQSVEAACLVARTLGKRAAFIHGGTTPKDRGAIVGAFQEGQIDVLVGSLATMSESLTLTASDCVIMLETSFQPSKNEQAVRRIHRLGQEHPCTVYDLITPDSIDSNKRALLAAKTDHQMSLLTYADFAALL